MLEGLPDVGRYVRDLVVGRRQRGPLGVVVYHHLGDLVHAARHALGHYFPISLAEPYLQNSSLGTPYQKWAYFTNQDFQQVDECLRRLLVAVHRYYADVYDPLATREPTNCKDAEHWFRKVATGYVCCAVDQAAPRLTVTAVSLAGWVEPGGTVFRNVWNVATRERDRRDVPAVLDTRVIPIDDRTRVRDLCRVGSTNLAALRQAHESLAAGLRATLTVDDLLAPQKGTLSEYWIGIITAPGVPKLTMPGVSPG